MTIMKKFCAVLPAMFAAANLVWGSLGDGSDKIDDAYGSIIQRRLRDDGTVSVLYHKDRYLYFVLFAEGRSVLERYSRADGRELSEREISRFLKANAAGATWIRSNTAGEQRFKRSDGHAEATYGKMNGRPALRVREVNAGRSD
jgi:hypothetical protein